MFILVAMFCASADAHACQAVIWSKESFKTLDECVARKVEELPKIPAPLVAGYCFKVPQDEAA